ncbi:MAG: hypothetical protein AAFY48_02380 [Bacteroidota bacterium]
MTEKEEQYLADLLKKSTVETSEDFTDRLLVAVRQSAAPVKQSVSPKWWLVSLFLIAGGLIHFLVFRMLNSASSAPVWLPQGGLAAKVIFSLVLLLLLNTTLRLSVQEWPLISGEQRE